MKINDIRLIKDRKETGLTCYTASADCEEGQLKAATGFTCPSWQDELVCVLREQDKYHKSVLLVRFCVLQKIFITIAVGQNNVLIVLYVTIVHCCLMNCLGLIIDLLYPTIRFLLIPYFSPLRLTS